MAAAAVFLEYFSAVFWGIAVDKHGPARVAFIAAVLFAVGWGMLSWRYTASLRLGSENQPEGQWVWLAAYFALAGASTSASVSGGDLLLLLFLNCGLRPVRRGWAMGGLGWRQVGSNLETN